MTNDDPELRAASDGEEGDESVNRAFDLAMDAVEGYCATGIDADQAEKDRLAGWLVHSLQAAEERGRIAGLREAAGIVIPLDGIQPEALLADVLEGTETYRAAILARAEGE